MRRRQSLMRRERRWHFLSRCCALLCACLAVPVPLIITHPGFTGLPGILTAAAVLTVALSSLTESVLLLAGWSHAAEESTVLAQGRFVCAVCLAGLGLAWLSAFVSLSLSREGIFPAAFASGLAVTVLLWGPSAVRTAARLRARRRLARMSAASATEE